MSTQQTWREACRALAETRAQEEARKQWEIPAGTVVPFDYRWEHVKEVVTVALHLCDVTGADAEVVEAAAWLHDIRKMEEHHAAAGAVEAGPFLANTDFPPEKITAVVDAIAKHEGFTRPPDAPALEPLEAAVLWDADKLTKLGVAALLFSFGSPYVKGKDTDTRYDFANDFVRNVLSHTVTSMNTAPARAMAEVRYANTIAFLNAWAAERNPA